MKSYRKRNCENDKFSSLGMDIVKSFHEQFAQNQNHHQSLFLQVLTVLLTVLVGFGYIYIRVDADSKELKITVETLYAFLTLAMYLLSLGIALILNTALGFRRDQMVACNIRMKTKVMERADEQGDNFFPPTFNPVDKTKLTNWMPGFHFIFFVTLIVVKALLVSSVVFNCRFRPSFDLSLPISLVTFALMAIFVSFCVDCYTTRHFLLKWRKTAKAGPERLHN